jgi:hypothetical protein
VKRSENDYLKKTRQERKFFPKFTSDKPRGVSAATQKVNEDKAQMICFLCHRSPVEAHLTLQRLDIPFESHVKYPGVISHKTITWIMHIEMIKAKAFTIFLRVYSCVTSG